EFGLELNAPVLPPYLIGRDVVQRPHRKYIIDFFVLSESEARERYPSLYQHVLDRVWPERQHNSRLAYRQKWWIFAEPRPTMRRALQGLTRFIGTPYTAKFRPFVFIDGGTLPDAMVYVIASPDAYVLGVLSSRAHVLWALSAGGRLGIGNDPRYTSTATFLPFAFPDTSTLIETRIRHIAEQLDTHRKRQQTLHTSLTLTAMYNVLEKLRAGKELTPKERGIHDQGLVSVLKQLHDDLDAAVFDAYEWPYNLSDEEVLERLVALNAERAEEERRGIVRWLRPEFQNPAGTPPVQAATGLETQAPAAEASAGKHVRLWPKELPAQIAAVREIVAANANESWTAERTMRAFKGAKRTQVEVVLESLSALGLLVTFSDATGRQWTATR
ncbi:MAG: class I SAM-dependent DNA methyltransferase, partial [Acidobacteriota bacterium]|nr:class I SAM-dependent DNA methyltransferase [Acidobacteriota bacterium]